MIVDLPTSPEVQVLGDAVVIRGQAALDAYRLLTEGIRFVRQRDAIEPGPRLALVVAAFKAAARPDCRPATPEFREGPTSASLRTGELVGIKEVARMCDVGERQARNLAPSLGGWKRPSGAWAFDRGLVEAYLTGSREQSALDCDLNSRSL